MNRLQRQLAALVPLLLVITASELALNRLAVPALRMPAAGEVGIAPPLWHQLLDYLALFLHYFGSMLALAALAVQIAAIVRDRERHAAALRYSLAFTCTWLAALAAAAVVASPGEQLTFFFETAFTALLVCVAISQLRPGGSVAAKLGVALVSLPLALHYYGPLASRTVAGREALWLGLPDQVQSAGQWGIVAIALASPYLFSPKPASRALARPFPAIAALAVALASGLLLHHSYEVGMIVATRGFGFDIGPAAPAPQVGLYLLALASIAWTTIACLVAPVPARRRIGVALGLVIAGGYGFTWPLHYLVSALGLLALADAARRVPAEEAAVRASPAPAEARESSDIDPG